MLEAKFQARRTAVAVVLVLVLVGTLGAAAGAWAQEFIVLGTPLVNIRTGPSTGHVIVGRADKGDIFKLISRSGDWLEIAMFSGDHRYVFAAPYVYDLTRAQLVPGHRMTQPESADTRRAICRDLRAAKDRARSEAAEIIPASVDADRNAAFRRIMEDRLILETMHILGVQPAMYDELSCEE